MIGLSSAALYFPIPLAAQVFEPVHAFVRSPENPNSTLIQGSDGNFYGTSFSGGSGMGTVFKMTPAGVVTILVDFTGPNGSEPLAALVLGIDGNFHGTTSSGGSDSRGTVFKVTPAGVITTLVHFTGPNGSFPGAGL